MINNKAVSMGIALVLMTLIFGCSGSSSPVDPGEDTLIMNSPTIPVGVSDLDENGNPVAGWGLMGIYELNIDVDKMSAELTPLRSSALTDVLEVVDITNFLSLAPCTKCVKLQGVNSDPDGNVIIKIGIKHPFAAGNPTEPPTGRNRADLHVFNVEGTLVSDTAEIDNFPQIGQSISDFLLINADGYSSYLDAVLETVLATQSSIHPYILHFDDYSAGNYDPLSVTGFTSVTDPPPSGNLVMAMGADFDYQDYVIKARTENRISLAYTVGCTYAVASASKAERFTPEYRIPQHVKKAACEVKVRILENLLESSDPLSTASLAIDIVDMNHAVAVGTALDEMEHDSSVGGVQLEVPGVYLGVTDVPLTNTGGSGHDPLDPLTYETSITNELSAAPGMYKGLVKVTDTYPAGANSSPLLLGNDGIQRVSPIQNPLEGLFAIPEFATYQVFEIEVYGVINDDPVAILLPEDPEIYQNRTVNFDGTTSYDTDGSIVQYSFDFDWDGDPLNFVPDETNATGLVTSDPYTTLGTYTAGLRVTDNYDGQAYDSVTVTVSEYTGQCPDAPFAGYAMTQPFTYDDYYSFSLWTGWSSDAGANIDVDMLSTGEGICIYTESGLYNGELRYFDPMGSDGTAGSFTPVGSDYPGEQGISIDVDSEDLVIFVTTTDFFDNGNPPDEWQIEDKCTNARDYFVVVDPFTGPSSEQQVNVGTQIQAIDIDGYDDVWVLDVDNVMHNFTKANGYNEDTSRQFDLDTVTSGTFSGEVFDFAINFYNEAFFVLAQNASGQCDLWRFECDGYYESTVGGNANPLVNVFPQSTQGVADITIDNLDGSGNHLTGDQDSQIVVVGGNYSTGWSTMVVRVDAELDAPAGLMVTESSADGLTNVFFDQVNNELWGFERGMWADSWSERWFVPAEWQ